MKKLILLTLVLSSISSFSQCDDFEAEYAFNGPTCFGYTDGSVTINVTGGEGDLTFTIADSDGTELNIANSNTANELGEGWYYTTVVDEDGCIIEDSVYIAGPGIIDIDLTTMTSNTPPDCDGYAVVDTVYNYSSDYLSISYFWNPNPEGIEGLGADSTYSLCPDDYTVTINDENGCSNVFEFTIGWFASIADFSNTKFTITSNSATQEIRIELSEYNEALTIDFYNNTGEKVYASQLNGVQTTLNPQLNVGMYIYSIREADRVLTTGKFVFE